VTKLADIYTVTEDSLDKVALVMENPDPNYMLEGISQFVHAMRSHVESQGDPTTHLTLTDFKINSLVLCLPTLNCHYFIPHIDTEGFSVVYLLGDEDKIMKGSGNDKAIILGRIKKMTIYNIDDAYKILKDYKISGDNTEIVMVEIEEVEKVKYLGL